MPFLNYIAPAIGAGMGLMLQGQADRRQLSQQRKLQQLQIQGQKEMGQFNYEQQMKLWEATNYSAQMKQIEKAGLNPALLYGMGGGGGVTAAANPGNVSGADAPKGGQEIQSMTGMGIQLATAQAQMELIKAQTRKTNTEADNLGQGGIDTQVKETNIEGIKQGINSAKARQVLDEIEADQKRLDLAFANQTYDQRATAIEQNNQEQEQQIKQLRITNEINEETKQAMIEIARTNAINATLQSAILKAQEENIKGDTQQKKAATDKLRSDIKVNEQQIKTMAGQLAQGWDKLTIEDQQRQINEFLANIQANYPSIGGAAGRFINDGLDGLRKLWGADKDKSDKKTHQLETTPKKYNR